MFHIKAITIKVKIMLLIARLVKPCRMNLQDMCKENSQCYICTMRGGWVRCKKSRVFLRYFTKVEGNTFIEELHRDKKKKGGF